MAAPYTIIFMGDLEEWILQNSSFKPLVWWRYIDIFLLWQHGEEKLKEFLGILNCYQVFENVAITGFRKGKSLKEILVRAKVHPLKIEKGFCGPCKKPVCKLCQHITKTHQFELSSMKHIYSIRLQNLNCASQNVAYVFTCKICHKQYTRIWKQI